VPGFFGGSHSQSGGEAMKLTLMVFLGIIILNVTAASFAGSCGDVNNSGTINILDVTYLINYIYKGGPDLDCGTPFAGMCGDADNSGIVNLLDITYLISFLYSDGPEPDCEKTGTVTDAEGNVYQTVRIGSQWWMAENLRATHYRNGDLIPRVTDPTAWQYLTTGARCEYDNNTDNIVVYGRLYNWFAVSDNRGIAPEGWHVPTDNEWKQMEVYVGISQFYADEYGWRGTDEGGKLKESGTVYWYSPNTGATNESGFTARPGGLRYSQGYFSSMGRDAYFWTSMDFSITAAFGRNLNYTHSDICRYAYMQNYGFSVRCVKD
jgi:uncharacterized protein (TIGR02145 family)